MSEFVFLFRSNYLQAISTPERAQRRMQTWLAWMRGSVEVHPDGATPA
ncbi:MAG TPA: hypothetical protein VHC69_28185 [Polyangiaceae bacterium]|nr:hypothetical protein [Polyangiaceae bacterium]